jgi:hypothetical protein
MVAEAGEKTSGPFSWANLVLARDQIGRARLPFSGAGRGGEKIDEKVAVSTTVQRGIARAMRNIVHLSSIRGLRARSPRRRGGTGTDRNTEAYTNAYTDTYIYAYTYAYTYTYTYAYADADADATECMLTIQFVIGSRSGHKRGFVRA